MEHAFKSLWWTICSPMLGPRMSIVRAYILLCIHKNTIFSQKIRTKCELYIYIKQAYVLTTSKWCAGKMHQIRFNHPFRNAALASPQPYCKLQGICKDHMHVRSRLYNMFVGTSWHMSYLLGVVVYSRFAIWNLEGPQRVKQLVTRKGHH